MTAPRDSSDDVRDSTARTFYLLAHADKADAEGGPDPGPGGDWDDFVAAGPSDPPFNQPAADLADAMIADLAEWNTNPLTALLDDYLAAGGPDARRFGHSLALRYLGHGVSPDDDVRNGSGYKAPAQGRIEMLYWDILDDSDA